MAARFSTPTGTVDILPDEWPYWNQVMDMANRTAQRFAYRRIETPTLGDLSLFSRATGEGSDIVEKEMYAFRDQGGDELALRPEGTAPVMRAYLQHGMSRLPQPVKLYYIERMYRRERPQRGRLREHHQFGCEAIGVEDPYVDVEMISLLCQFYESLGLLDLSLHLNSIGDQRCRPQYVQLLREYLTAHASQLSALDQERISRNPLRVLDTKEPESRAVVENAPSVLDHLCSECSAHWERLRHGLDTLGVEYEIDPALVRGLDYYTRTVFEFLLPSGDIQLALGGGGRYDALAEAVGGPHIPGIGFGTGIERLVLTLKDRDIAPADMSVPRAYIVHIGTGTEDAALQLANTLRSAGVSVATSYGDRSAKAQLKAANASGARYAVIVGEDELRDGRVAIRDLKRGDQTFVGLTDATHFVQSEYLAQENPAAVAH